MSIVRCRRLRLPSPKPEAWPFEEARRLIARLEKLKGGAEKTVIFETGYGPSGLPHIGTFGEVARTSMVRHAFELLTEGRWKTRLICFSDDMDGLRKVPSNVPNQELLHAALNKPLTAVPDPFGKFESFAHHNNAMLRDFLDRFGFSYEFMSATEAYKSGRFDETLLQMLKVYDKVMDIILPTLGPERRATYSPFLPVSPTSGRVLQVPMVERHPEEGHHRLRRPRHRQEGRDDGHRRRREVPVEGRLGAALDGARRRLRDGRQGPHRIRHAVLAHLQGARRHAARGLQLRAVPRRQGREDLQVEGQRPDHRRVAALRQPREPVAVHVPEAEVGEAAVLRRHPARGRRVPAVARRLSAPGRQGPARQCGLARARRQSARRRHAAHLRAAAQSRRRLERRRQGRAVGLHPPPRARASAPRRIRCSISSPATRCATTPTS